MKQDKFILAMNYIDDSFIKEAEEYKGDSIMKKDTNEKPNTLLADVMDKAAKTGKKGMDAMYIPSCTWVWQARQVLSSLQPLIR